MSLLTYLKDWKHFSEIFSVIQPYILKLAQNRVPIAITKLYENLAKYAQPLIDSLLKLKIKVKTSPNELDDFCFRQGVSALESFANHLLKIVSDLKK
ncbi:hypothetical protein IJX73_00920 [bacterium]|nr:hypothetical protein [bacterium]MBQ9149471.1 hypothetical protein [bacterium]